MFQLRTFGGLGIERDGVELDGIAAHRKSLALVAYLAAQGSAGRERLMAHFWPESEPERARGSLKQTIHLLRRQLEAPGLFLGTAELRLNPQVIESDVGRFRAALAAGSLEEAVVLCAGPFLDGVHLDGAPGFERWLDAERDALARAYREALESLASRARGAGDLPAEVAWLRRLQAADPFSGGVALELVDALDRAGDRAGALRHARVHELLVEGELGLPPDPALLARVAQLRQSDAGRGPDNPAASRPDPVTSHPPPSHLAPGPGHEDAGGGPPRQITPGQITSGQGAPGPDAPGPPPPARRARRPAVVGLVSGTAGAVLLLWWLLSAPLSPLARGPAGSDLPPITSVAVLPFVDLSPGGDQAHWADGIAEEILNSLAGIRELRVPARTSSFHFKGQTRPVGEIARALGVDAVLEGSVRTAGDQMRITAQLVDARVDTHLWSGTFDLELGDVLQAQAEIAAAVAAAMRVELSQPGGRGVGAPPLPAEAHERFLQGRFHWNRRSLPDLLLARDFFEEATVLAPDHARAWAGLALVYAVLPIGFTPPISADEARAHLESAADRALALDPTRAEAHAARALAYHFAFRWDEAEREFRRALELDPRYATAHQWYGEHLAKLGRGTEGVASMRRALELDPHSLVIRNDLGLVLFLDRRTEEARVAWDETVAMDPGFAIPHYFLHRLAIMEGKVEAAEASGRRWAELSGGATAGEISLLSRATGHPDLRPEGLQIIAQWAEREAPRWLDVAFYRLYLGDRDGALEALESGVWARAPMMAQIGNAPWLDPLRGDPRLEAMVRELGFPGM